MTTIKVGLVGAGFLAATRARCYRRVAPVGAEVVAIASRTPERARQLAQQFGIPRVCATADELLALPELDAVDLCVPNAAHRALTEAAARAGKHVVCTKPLAAYVGQDLAGEASDAAIAGRDRRAMLAVVRADAEAMVQTCAAHHVQLCYGENWIYAPAIQRAAALLATAKAKILELRGYECHSGSHSPYSKVWRHAGGGALLRLGAHPIGAMLWLKAQEGLRTAGAPILPVAVTAEVADLTKVVKPGDDVRIARGWQDVETWGCVIIRFSDGCIGVAYGSDVQLGGMESRLEVRAANCQVRCNLSPAPLLQAYAPDATVFAGEYLQEKLDSGAGWTTPMPDEDWTSGHQAMCADFAAAIAARRPALATGELGAWTARIVYAAYVAAVEGRRVDL